jgi:hypothetical protein
MDFTYAEIVSTLALFASGASLWLHRARWKRDEADREPEIQSDAKAARGLLGWTIVTITIRNRSDTTLKINRITVIWPLNGKIGKYITTGTGPEEFRPPLNPPADAKRSINPKITVAQAGKQAGRMPVTGWQTSPGDAHSSSFLVSGRPRSLLILRITLSSSDTARRTSWRYVREIAMEAAPVKSTKQPTI